MVFDDGQKNEVKVVKGEAIGSNLPADPNLIYFQRLEYQRMELEKRDRESREGDRRSGSICRIRTESAPIEEVKVVIDVDGVKSEVKVIKR